MLVVDGGNHWTAFPVDGGMRKKLGDNFHNRRKVKEEKREKEK